MENQKIKIVRRSGGTEIYLNDLPHEDTDIPELRYAMQFFEAFSPGELLRKLTAQEENAVIVFRTSSEQIQAFIQIMEQTESTY